MHVLALCMVMAAGVLWASSGIAAQHLFAHSRITSMELTAFRMVCAGAIMLVLEIAKGTFQESWHTMRQRPRLWISIATYGLVGLMAMHYTYFQSIAEGNAAAATVIQYTCPAMVICYVALRKKRWPSGLETLAVVLAVTGTVFLVTGGDLSRLSVPAACVFWGLVSGVFFAFTSIYPKHLLTLLSNHFLLAMGMFAGAAASWLLTPETELAFFMAPEIWFDVLWIVTGGTAVAFFCFNFGLARLTPGEATVTATIEPAASVFMAYILFGMHFGLWEILGIAMVLAAIAVPALRKRTS